MTQNIERYQTVVRCEGVNRWGPEMKLELEPEAFEFEFEFEFELVDSVRMWWIG
jgi:hypothetical protein